jgi:hypothetical protein
MNDKPDGIKELAESFAEFVRRARRARIPNSERRKLLEFVQRNAELVLNNPPPTRESEADQDDQWRSLGYK